MVQVLPLLALILPFVPVIYWDCKGYAKTCRELAEKKKV